MRLAVFLGYLRLRSSRFALWYAADAVHSAALLALRAALRLAVFLGYRLRYTRLRYSHFVLRYAAQVNRILTIGWRRSAAPKTRTAAMEGGRR